MAVFSIGKKIGGLDIRIGVPPSKPQFPLSEINQRIGYINRSSNRNSVYNVFRSGMTLAGGFARPANFMVTIIGPTAQQIESIPNATIQRIKRSTDTADALKKNSQVVMDLFCTDVQIPQRTIMDDVNEQYYGPSRAIAKNISYDEITLDFYTSVDFEERMYFEAWQNAIVDPKSFNVGYYDDYAKNCTVIITPLTKTFTAALANFNPTGDPGRDREEIRAILGNTSGESAYQGMCLEAYPKTIQSTQLSYSSKDAVVKTTVVIKFREYASTVINTLAQDNLESLKSLGDNRNEYRRVVQDIKGGLLDNLPFGIGSVIGSVGRQVYEKIRRDLPIGRVTGGRVFPKGLPDPKVIRDILY